MLFKNIHRTWRQYQFSKELFEYMKLFTLNDLICASSFPSLNFDPEHIELLGVGKQQCEENDKQEGP